ncbi:MAG: single-stranded DNA-binding protein [Corallococcus sp.]|nr:single-stranded DNA-binding protein [Corallococcus sp.]MCM1359671.1 single-stranded DNA-binding protein [Corallococcus sp.]MCM1395380.1 single-stranded DNA-binding protein [Corallococcus sp.]
MDTNVLNNTVTLSGTVMNEPTFSHEIYGEKFYEIILAVKRLSGMEDVLPVSVSEHLLTQEVALGNRITVSGQFRSYNKTVEERSKLMLTVFARDIMPFDETLNPNTLSLTGYVCKPPVFRKTPFEREICDILIAVNRQYGKSDYIPCIVWGRNARFAQNLPVGSHVTLTGRVQSRNYQKKLDDETVVTRTAYEVSANKIDLLADDVLNCRSGGSLSN